MFFLTFFWTFLRSSTLEQFKFKLEKIIGIHKGPSINDVGNWEGGGVKNWSNLPMNSTKNCQHGRGGCQKSGKIADVVYGWSLTKSFLIYQLQWAYFIMSSEITVSFLNKKTETSSKVSFTFLRQF